jgi:Cu/Ag efflux pump CusA
MLNRLIQLSLAHRAIVVGLSLLLLALGVQSGLRLPVEVLPDLTKPTVIVLTEAPGLAPEEIETRVTQPLESALLGVAGDRAVIVDRWLREAAGGALEAYPVALFIPLTPP